MVSHHEIAITINGDNAATQTLDMQLLLDKVCRCLFHGNAFVLHRGGDVIGHYVTHEKLTMAGCGDRGRFVVGIGAGTDDWGVANPTRYLGVESAGGRSRREITAAIPNCRTHGTTFIVAAGSGWQALHHPLGIR